MGEPLQDTLQQAFDSFGKGEIDDALQLGVDVLEKAPENVDALALMGMASHQQRRYDDALEYFERAAAIEPDLPDIYNNLGEAHRCLQRYDEAVEAFKKALALRPDYPQAHNNLGLSLVATGNREQAREHFHAAIAADPAYARAYMHLAEIQRSDDPDPLRGSIERTLEEYNLSTEDRATLHFALAKLYDDADQFEPAFDNARIANELDRKKFNRFRFAWRVQEVRAVFTREFFEKRADFGIESGMPVIVVGTPRSGKSLIEHILSGHPEVYPGGEMEELRHLTRALPQMIGSEKEFPKCVPRLQADRAKAIAHQHINRLRKRSGSVQRVIDTLPGNFMRLGLIQLLFPNARIVHCIRNPLDVGLACYFRNFNSLLPWACDLEMIGHFCRIYDEMMDHWREVLPVPILELNYEDLVREPEKTAKRIMSYCGLEWSDELLSRRYLGGTEKVRRLSGGDEQAVDSWYLDRWKNYRDHLDPLKKGLGKLAPATAE